MKSARVFMRKEFIGLMGQPLKFERNLAGTTTAQYLKTITDTNTICSSIKDFFRNMISEPILTYRLMPRCITAFTNEDKNQMKEILFEVSSVYN